MFNLVKVSGTSGTEPCFIMNNNNLSSFPAGTSTGTVLAQSLPAGTDWLETIHSRGITPLESQHLNHNS